MQDSLEQPDDRPNPLSFATTAGTQPSKEAPTPADYVSKLESLLYDAVRELGYIQDYEDGWPPELIATAQGESIVEEGMKLLRVSDLSAETWKDVKRKP
jgi:hypothetical protein